MSISLCSLTQQNPQHDWGGLLLRKTAHNSVSDMKNRYSEKKENTVKWRPTEEVVPEMGLDFQKDKARRAFSPPTLSGGQQHMETPDAAWGAQRMETPRTEVPQGISAASLS